MINPRKAWNEIGSVEVWTGQTVAWNEGYDAIEETVVMTINPSFTGTALGTFNDSVALNVNPAIVETTLQSHPVEITFTMAPSATYLSTYNFEFEAAFSLGANLGHTLQAVFDSVETFQLELSESILAGKFIYDQVALSINPGLSGTAVKEYSDSVNFTIRGFEFAADGQGVALEFIPIQLQVGMAEASFALYDDAVDMQVSMEVFGFSGREQIYSIEVSFNLGADMFMKNFQWGRTAPTFGDWNAQDAGQSNDWTPDAPTSGSWT
jgi:hypothetical protein